MANTTASLKTLARNLKNAAAKNKAPRVVNSKKVAAHWCGCHSELPTDSKWVEPRGSLFSAQKREKGNNRRLEGAICQAAYNKKYGI